MAQFSDEEKQLLEQYVTNVGGDVFAVTGLNGIVGSVYARYSRAKTNFQETLLKEFVKEGNLDPKHADKLIERVLIAFGDDSVGELEGAHLSLENISIVATKEIEDRRIGGSPIEKSTRYVFFDQKDEEGNYLYVRPQEIMASPHAQEYVEVMDFVFDTYARLIPEMQEFYKERFPLEEAMYDVLGTGEKQTFSELTEDKDKKAFKITHKMDLRTKSCDSLRCLLPISTKTNVGLFGNGRFYQMLISHMMSTPYAEVRELAKKTHEELSKIIPQYVRRAQEKTYNMQIDANMAALAGEILSHIAPEPAKPTTLVPQALSTTEEYLVAHMLYGYTEHSFMQIYQLVSHMDPELQQKVKDTYVGTRETRRDRPGRAFESGYTYTFDLFADYGTYKDLMRHRMNSQIRQAFSPRHGMIIPEDLTTAGYDNDINACQEKVLALYEKLKKDVGATACYVTMHGNRVRWIQSFNDREAMHLLELRTTKQGHPQYRKLCQLMHEEIQKVSPWRASIMKFVDHNDYNSARGDSEARQRVKEQKLEEKYKDAGGQV